MKLKHRLWRRLSWTVRKKVDDYQSAYDKAVKCQNEIVSSSNGLWNFLFGSTDGQQLTQDLSLFEPTNVRMSIAFNDYVFTEHQVKTYFEEQLGL